MGYRVDSQIDPAVAQREVELLQRGFSYKEIAALTGVRAKTVSERNRLVYKIDIWEAFRRRIEREGIPNRLAVSDAFGYWFAGFFDGEGSIIAFTRPTKDPRYAEYRLGVRIQVRDDDAQLITRIYDNLQVGRVAHHPGHGKTNPTVSWTCERVEDLAEVIVPLFDRYPLHSKKAKEYAIWKPIVLQRYITTLGGYSNRRGIPDDERAAFNQAIEAIANIRAYGGV